MRLIDADNLCEEFKQRQKAALNWKEQAIMNDNLEAEIRADAVLAFLSEVKLTIDNAPTIECENCDYRKFTETFINGVVEVMNKNGISSVEQLSEILKGAEK